MAEIAPTSIPVLIIGESGTGKEVMALLIHRRSGRQSGPFQKVVCDDLGPGAFEDFLHGKLGENGATQVVSNSGTLYLDEISELDPACQPKLLRALPEGDEEFAGRGLSARVISSSRRSLDEKIRSGRFREDLFYRLNDVCLRLPPLRERRDDIPALVDFFLEKYSAQLARPKPALSDGTLARLEGYAWPGNIRQLEHEAKKIVALGDDRRALADLDLAPAGLPPNGELGRLSLKEASRAASLQAERELIMRTLERTRWNRKRAAQELQISYKALLYKLKQHTQ